VVSQSNDISSCPNGLQPCSLAIRISSLIFPSGVCGGDHAIKDGTIPGSSYPRVPGHEVVGTVVSIGPGAKRWAIGDIVGCGWSGGYCFECKPCRQGNFIACQKHFTHGLNIDGGWAEYMCARWESLVAVPKGMSPEQAGRLHVCSHRKLR
jgi:propanol-preferring alcohol dehydrogenase